MTAVRVRGLDSLQRRLAQIEREMDRALPDAAVAGANVIRDEARAIGERVAMSERPGGHMVRGIRTFRPERIPSGVRVAIGVQRRLWYGVFPEFGTSRMAARPFMRPALDSKAREAEQAFAERMRQALRQAGR